jgi:sorbose reductase
MTWRCVSSSEVQLADGDLRPVWPMLNLTGKNFVVTGGGRGIGYATTRAIAEMGGNVVVLDVLPKPVDDFASLSKDFGAKTLYIFADVTSDQSSSKGFEQAVNELGSIDGMWVPYSNFNTSWSYVRVTAAGIALDKPFLQYSRAEVSRIMDINVDGIFLAAKLAAEQTGKQNTDGSIVMIASICSHCVVPGQRLSAYHASKGAVRMLSQALSVELAPKGIRTNSVSPGYIQTDMTKTLRDQLPHLVDIMHSAPPLKHIGNRNDLTGAIVYLLSDASSHTTGTNIQITGGLHAGRIEDPLFQWP